MWCVGKMWIARRTNLSIVEELTINKRLSYIGCELLACLVDVYSEAVRFNLIDIPIMLVALHSNDMFFNKTNELLHLYEDSLSGMQNNIIYNRV